jgi:FtsZ-binding cell division protein ZapB
MTVQEPARLRALRGARPGRRARGQQLVGRTLSLELPPSLPVRREQSALAGAHSMSSLRLNSLDAVSSVYTSSGGKSSSAGVVGSTGAGRAATPIMGARRGSAGAGPGSEGRSYRRRGAGRRESAATTSSSASSLTRSAALAAGRSASVPGLVGGSARRGGEVLGPLMSLDSLASGDGDGQKRAQACREVLQHVAAHTPEYQEILGRVQHEYDDACAVLRLEVTSLKKTLAALRSQHQQSEHSIEALRRENQTLRQEAGKTDATTTKLRAEVGELQAQLQQQQQQQVEAAAVQQTQLAEAEEGALRTESGGGPAAAAAAAAAAGASDANAAMDSVVLE